MKYILLILYLLYFVVSSSAQSINPLKVFSDGSNEKSLDSLAVAELINSALEYKVTQPDTSLTILASVLLVCEQFNYNIGMADCLHHIGNHYKSKSEYTKAIEYYQKSQAIYEELNYQEKISLNAGIMGNVYYFLSQFTLASENYQKKLDVCTEISDNVGIAQGHIGLGNINYIHGEYATALHHYHESLKINKIIGSKDGIARSLNNIGKIRLVLGEYDSALEYYLESINIFEKLGSKENISFVLNDIGNIFYYQNELDSAQKYYYKSLEIEQEIGNKQGVLKAYNNIANIYSLKNELVRAEDFFEKSIVLIDELAYEHGKIFPLLGLADLASRRGNYEDAIGSALDALKIAQKLEANAEIKETSFFLYKTFKKTGEFQKALEYFEIHKQVNDSLLSVEKSQKIANLEAIANLERKEKEVALLNKNQEILETEKAFQKQLNYWIIGGLVAVLLLTYFIFISWKSEKSAKELVQLHNEEILIKNEEINRQKLVLQRQTEALVEANTTKDKLFAIIGHDLRAPIATLQDIFKLAVTGDFTQEEFEIFSSKLLGKIRNLSFTLDNLLNWAQSQMMGIKSVPKRIQLSAIAMENILFLEGMAYDKRISIENLIDEEAYSKADANHISIVFRNLISNALKFTPEHGSVSLLSEKLDGEWKVSIVDTGIGIPENKVSQVFHKNQSFTTYGTKGEKGTGLGLLFCKEMIEKNHGRIGVESYEGRGTTIWFTLPVASVLETVERTASLN